MCMMTKVALMSSMYFLSLSLSVLSPAAPAVATSIDSSCVSFFRFWRGLDSQSGGRATAAVEQVRNPIFSQEVFKWLLRAHSLMFCLAENLSGGREEEGRRGGARWSELASSGTGAKLLPRNGLDGVDRPLRFTDLG